MKAADARVVRLERAAGRRFPKVGNRAMARMLVAGVAVDVCAIGRATAPGVYQLDRFIDGVDYCDVRIEAWIWSIGVELPLPEGCGFSTAAERGPPGCERPGCAHVLRAATDARFYQATNYLCLWLR